MSDCIKYFGKYRGTCTNNADPKQEGRIQAVCADVSALSPTTWAMPALPVGGPQYGIFALPALGSGVWIEFENGNSENPIWTGCYMGNAGEVPAASKLVPPGAGITMQTLLQNSLTLSDVEGPTGGFMIKTKSGVTLIVNDTGISLRTPQGASLVMTAKTVTINDGALVIN